MQSECREMDGLANIVIKKMFFFFQTLCPTCYCDMTKHQVYLRGMEWSLREFPSIRAAGIFLRALAVIYFVMRVVST